MSTVHEAPGDEDSQRPIRTLAGTGDAALGGDKGPARAAQLNGPYGIAMDSAGTLFFSDHRNHRVRKVTTDGRIKTVAGTGDAGFDGDGGPAASAPLNFPREVAVDSAGAVYIADASNHRIRKVATDGTITTFAGNGTGGFGGDGGPATEAQLNYPHGVAVDSTGAVYIAEWGNHRVRKVEPDGTISTFAGTGTGEFGGDGGLATEARLNHPQGLAVDAAGTLYIADGDNQRIRKVAVDGTISTFAGTGVAGFGGDGGPAASAKLYNPMGMVVDGTGALYIADSENHRVRKVTADEKIDTVVGGDSAGREGDGGPAVAARLNMPFGLAVDCVDALYIADFGNHRVRKVAAPRMAGLPESGTVVCWANVRSRLRMAVVRESTVDGAEIHQTLPVARDHQRWRLVVAGEHDGDVLYRIENVRSGKVLEVGGPQETAWAVVAQRAYEGAEACHQQWRLIPVGPVSGTPRRYELANRGSGLLLQTGTNARAVIKQDSAEGDHRGRQWQLIPV
ncbi:RICIN domain-containing protein [Streptomyces sp. CA-181903]|uniref:NHL domain-containing protein n=1 Tax=Streptomyces sp. CA-181903 TaxID=3240055 RepID=UPI003D8CE0E0